MGNGYVPEIMAMNFNEYSLFPCTCEGERLTGQVALVETVMEPISKVEQLQGFDSTLKKAVGLLRKAVGGDVGPVLDPNRLVPNMRVIKIFEKGEDLPDNDSLGKNQLLLKVVDPAVKPAGIFWVSRLFRATAYAMGLTSSDTVAAGSNLLPKIIEAKKFSYLHNQFRSYFYIPRNETTGITLDDAIMACKDQDDFKAIPFSQALKSSEATPEWYKLLEYSESRYQADVNSSVDLAGITSSDKDTGALPEPNRAMVRDTIMPDARSAGYAVERATDYAFYDSEAKWRSAQELRDYGKIEAWYLTECERYRREGKPIYRENPAYATNPASVPERYENIIVFPNSIDGVPTAQWKDKVIQWSKNYSSDHVYYDVPDPKNDDGFVRWHSRADIAIYIPDPDSGEPMTEFERAVTTNKMNAPDLIARKLFIGYTMLARLSRSKLNSFTDQDRIAFGTAMSKDYKALYSNSIKDNSFYKFLVGLVTEVDSILLFTMEEFDALYRTGGAAGGAMRLINTAAQTFKTVGPPRG